MCVKYHIAKKKLRIFKLRKAFTSTSTEASTLHFVKGKSFFFLNKMQHEMEIQIFL